MFNLTKQILPCGSHMLNLLRFLIRFSCCHVNTALRSPVWYVLSEAVCDSVCKTMFSLSAFSSLDLNNSSEYWHIVVLSWSFDNIVEHGCTLSEILTCLLSLLCLKCSMHTYLVALFSTRHWTEAPPLTFYPGKASVVESTCYVVTMFSLSHWKL